MANINKLTLRERVTSGHADQRAIQRDMAQGEILAALLAEQQRTNALLEWLCNHFHTLNPVVHDNAAEQV